MFSGRQSAEKRRANIESAREAATSALRLIVQDDLKSARKALSTAPKTHFADVGWMVEMASAVIDLKTGRQKHALNKLIDICARLDETSLSRDDKSYLRLYALYRTAEASKSGKAPLELRALVEDFRFDHTLVSPTVRRDFPLKKVEENETAPPPPPPPLKSQMDF